jgi:hypothetical protein
MSLAAAISDLFRKKLYGCWWIPTGIVTTKYLPSKLPYVDNPNVDFNITLINSDNSIQNQIVIVYFKEYKSYVVLMGTQYCDQLYALQAAQDVIDDYIENKEFYKKNYIIM